MDPAELQLQMSTSSELDDGTGEASWVPCEWERRAAAAPGLGWSAVNKTKSFHITQHNLF